eukprot:Unigene10003_Nuclearia_a/m.30549 Unigene10003_Nuclearia_a/g.30549  ORF Unigene10003_Nuclearia_a/g.30549 Unigene10003_Nuclearia_a/m.30549 type:complete len:338 (+) Unigene10003_Nuclearia_a:986-1999(+)
MPVKSVNGRTATRCECVGVCCASDKLRRSIAEPPPMLPALVAASATRRCSGSTQRETDSSHSATSSLRKRRMRSSAAPSPSRSTAKSLSQRLSTLMTRSCTTSLRASCTRKRATRRSTKSFAGQKKRSVSSISCRYSWSAEATGVSDATRPSSVAARTSSLPSGCFSSSCDERDKCGASARGVHRRHGLVQDLHLAVDLAQQREEAPHGQGERAQVEDVALGWGRAGAGERGRAAAALLGVVRRAVAAGRVLAGAEAERARAEPAEVVVGGGERGVVGRAEGRGRVGAGPARGAGVGEARAEGVEIDPHDSKPLGASARGVGVGVVEREQRRGPAGR